MKRASLCLLAALVVIGLRVSPVQAQTQCVTNALAGGTGDAITVPLLPCGLATNVLLLTLSSANTTNSPTLQMVGFPPLPILNANREPLAIGALPGANAVVQLTGTGNAWLLLTNGVSGESSPITVSPSVVAMAGIIDPVAVGTVRTTGFYVNTTVGGALYSFTNSIFTADCLHVPSTTVIGTWVMNIAGGQLLASTCGAQVGGADNITAVESGLAGLGTLGGGTLVFDLPGVYSFNPATAYPTSMFNLVSNVSVSCQSPATVLKITTSNLVNRMFYVLNSSGNNYIRNCTLYGNSVAGGSGIGGAIEFALDSSAAANMENIGAPGTTLKNFAQEEWIKVYNNNTASFQINNWNFDGLRAISFSGNQFPPPAQAAIIESLGQESSSTATINGGSMRNCYVDGSYINAFYAGFNTNDAIMDHCILQNVGINYTNFTNAIHVAISYELITGHDTRPHGWTVSNTRCDAAQENCFYCERTDGCHFENNYIDNLPDIVGVTSEPPAGIRFTGGCGDASNNIFINNGNADVIVNNIDECTVNLTGNIGTATTAPTNGANTAVMIQSGQSTVSTGTGVVNLINDSFSRTGGNTGKSLSLLTDTTHGLGYVNLAGGKWIGSGYSIFASNVAGTGTVVTSGVSLSGYPFIRGFFAGIDFIAMTNPLYMNGVVVDGASATTNGWPLQLNAATNLSLSNVIVQNVASGVGRATDFTSACGSVNIEFRSVAAAFGTSGAPGLIAPTCTGQTGWFWKDFTGATLGWLYNGTSWVSH